MFDSVFRRSTGHLLFAERIAATILFKTYEHLNSKFCKFSSLIIMVDYPLFFYIQKIRQVLASFLFSKCNWKGIMDINSIQHDYNFVFNDADFSRICGKSIINNT
jgi:hypothetical protein